MSAKKTNKTLMIALLILVAVVAGLMARHLLAKDEFGYAGSLEATNVVISAQLPSVIEKVFVDEGMWVAPNQDLITLTCDDVKVAHQLAQKMYTRTETLLNKGVATPDQMDQIRAKLQDAQVSLDRCRIKSPISGVVLARFHEPGELAAPGLKLLTLANIKDIWTYIYVPQPEIHRIKPGMTLVGTVPEISDKTFTGTVVKINSEAEFTPKNVQTESERTRLVYGVKVSFNGANEDLILKPGMTMEIKLPKGS